MRPLLDKTSISMVMLCVASMMGCGGGGSGPNGTSQNPSSSAASDSAPASAPGTTSSGGDSSRLDPKAAAPQCVTINQPKSAGYNMTVTNSCSEKVDFSYCTAFPDAEGGTLFQCKAVASSFSPSGFTYSQGADSFAPGETKSLVGTRSPGQKVFVAACVAPDFAFISSFDTPTIGSNSTSHFICVK